MRRKESTAMVLGILLLSIVLQITAAVLALRLIPITGRAMAWILVAVSIVLTVSRRVITFKTAIFSDPAILPDAFAEGVALLASACLLLGLAGIDRVLRGLRDSRRSLAAREERYRRVFERSRAGMLLLEADGQRIHDANPAAAALYGYPMERLRGMDLAELDMPDGAGMAALMAEDGARGFTGVVSQRRADGRARSMEVYADPVEQAGGRRLLCILHDVTARVAAEEALRDSESKLRGLLDAVTESVLLLDPHGHVEAMNRTASAVLSLEPGAMSLTSLDEFPRPPSFPDALEILADVVREGRATTVAHNANGNSYEHVLYPVTDSTGRVTRVAHICRDVTERARAEEALRHGEARLNRAQAIAHIGSFERDMRTGKGYWSDEQFRLLGFEPGEIEPDFRVFYAMLHPEDRPRLDAVMAEAATDRTSFELEFQLYRRDGALRHMSSHAELERDDAGLPRRLNGTMQDVTERKRAEEALRLSEARLRRAQAIAHVGSFERDVLTGKATWSDELFRIFGYVPGEIEPSFEAFRERVHPQDRTSFERALAEAASGRGNLAAEFRYYPISGELRHGVIRAELEFDAQGRHVRIEGTFQDITERKHLEELRDDVERIMRHDLKSPLVASVNCARLLRKSDNLSKRQHELLDELEHLGLRTIGLVDLSLDLYKMETGTYVLQPLTVDLPRTLRRVARELSREAERKAVSVVLDVEGELARADDRELPSWKLPCEEHLLQGLLTNLMKNAVEASPESGEVRVSLRKGDGYVIAVHNMGVVPVEIRDRFFDKYVTAGKLYGTGLGTYSARLMAETLGGSIGFTSSEADGTTVEVRLPLVPRSVNGVPNGS